VTGSHQNLSYHSSVTAAADATGWLNNGQRTVSNADVTCQRQRSTKKMEADASELLMSSDRWLQLYGLKVARLDMNHLLRQIGFRHSDGKHFLRFLVALVLHVALFSKSTAS